MNNQPLLQIAVQLLPSCREHIHNSDRASYAMGFDTGNLEERAAKLAIKQASALLKAYEDMQGGTD